MPYKSLTTSSRPSPSDYSQQLSEEPSEQSDTRSLTINDNKDLMVPRFLPCDEIIGWKLTVAQNAKTKRDCYTYTVTCQTRDKSTPTETTSINAKCDGPCGATLPSRKMMLIGKCEHLLCKACYGIVTNDDGSFGCSNFNCWAEPSRSFSQEKKKYRQVVLKNQKHRAKILKEHGDDVQMCSDEALPKTPASSD